MQVQGDRSAWEKSLHAGGGHIRGGNDLILDSVDVVVTDTLTGNILMKLFGHCNGGIR